MKTAEKLTSEIMDLLRKDIEKINDELCMIIDTLTDEDGHPLPNTDKKMVNAMKEVGFSIYRQTEEIEGYKEDIIGEILG